MRPHVPHAPLDPRLVAMISELPPRIRAAFENIIGLGFWVGRGECKKPDFQRFMDPIIEQMEQLKEGFTFDINGRQMIVSVCLFATVFDLPAQAAAWGHKQYNGKQFLF
jgi:hypothetical protein